LRHGRDASLEIRQLAAHFVRFHMGIDAVLERAAYFAQLVRTGHSSLFCEDFLQRVECAQQGLIGNHAGLLD
jgi:hypothetical protein